MNLENKNIVLLIKTPVLGGAERQAIGFAQYCKEHFNCNVYFVSTHSGEMSTEFKSELNRIGENQVYYFGKYHLKFKKNWRLADFKNLIKTLNYLFKMTKGIKKFKPYMLIPFLNPPSKLAVLIYKYTGAKYSFWHQLGLDHFTKDFIENYAIQKTPVFIANARNGLTEITDSYKVSENKLFCLPQYTTMSYHEEDVLDLRVELGISKDSIVIGMISHFREEKLFNLLFDAFVSLRKHHNIHLILLGNASHSAASKSMYDELQRQKENSEFEQSISILSDYPISQILNLMDIGVLVSTIEGTPNVVMEYMLYGLPVVATNHVGCADLLESNEFLVDNDIPSLSKALSTLIKNETVRNETGQLNQELIQKYSLENYFERLKIILNSKDFS